MIEPYSPTSEEKLLSLVGLVNADDLLKALGIESTYRRSEDGVVMIVQDGEHREASEDMIRLHEQSVYDYHMDEAMAGIL
jgi:hypothetical protein